MPAAMRFAGMSKTADYDTLLTVCIQDLHRGEKLLGEALPDVAGNADGSVLKAVLDDASDACTVAAAALEQTGRSEGGAENLWMKGIVDDARRDTRSIVFGELLDTAIVGAIRKALAARIVSYDTAIAVAGVMGEADIEAALTEIRQRADDIDARLAECLPGQPGSSAFGKPDQTSS